MPHRTRLLAPTVASLLLAVCTQIATAQMPFTHHGEAVPRDVREMYDRGLQYLSKSQTSNGDWTDGQQGPGVTGLCLMVFLALGRRSKLRHLQKPGAKGPAEYHLVAELEHRLHGKQHVPPRLRHARHWPKPTERSTNRTCGQRRRDIHAVAASARLSNWPSARQSPRRSKNPRNGAWRYSPDANDADTSVSGAVLVGLLAARNAGIEVPDTAVDQAQFLTTRA